MILLSPLTLLFALLALPILALYMLRLRRPPIQVPSLLLWQRLLADRQANAPWQRLRHTLLLLLQLLLLTALVLALARPAWPVKRSFPGAIVILLDGSASMQALDGAPVGRPLQTRFTAAQDAARDLLSELSPGSPATIILATAMPQVLASQETSRLALESAIARASTASGEASWETALALAIGAARSLPSPPTPSLVIISDGGLPDLPLPQLPFKVEYRRIGHADANLAISALAIASPSSGTSTRPTDKSSPSKVELFTAVTNFSSDSRISLLSIYSGDRLIDTRQLQLAAGERYNFSLSLPACDSKSDFPCPGVYSARLSPPSGLSDTQRATWDTLPIDNQAFAIYTHPSSGKTLLLSAGNTFLEHLLGILPGIQPFRLAASQNDSGTSPPPLPNSVFDLYIFDGQIPATLPAQGSILWLNPPSNSFFDSTGVFTNTTNARLLPNPLTQGLSWDNIHVQVAKRINPPIDLETLVVSDGGPLVLAGEIGGRRIAVLTFDLHDSDLPLQVTFPLMFSNLVDYLLLRDRPASLDTQARLQPGDLLNLPVPPVGLEIIGPSGELLPILDHENNSSQVLLPSPGVYTLRQPGLPDQYLATNLFSSRESQLDPADQINLGGLPITSHEPEQPVLRETWPLIAALALGLLCLEFIVYFRQDYPAPTFSLPSRWYRLTLWLQQHFSLHNRERRS